MTGIQSALAIIGALVTLTAVAGGLWAVFRSSAQEATIKRQAREISEYMARIDYIEPRWKAADEQNGLLRELHNPSAQLGRIEDTQQRTVDLLSQQHDLLSEVATEMHRRGPRDE